MHARPIYACTLFFRRVFMSTCTILTSANSDRVIENLTKNTHIDNVNFNKTDKTSFVCIFTPFECFILHDIIE